MHLYTWFEKVHSVGSERVAYTLPDDKCLLDKSKIEVLQTLIQCWVDFLNLYF